MSNAAKNRPNVECLSMCFTKYMNMAIIAEREKVIRNNLWPSNILKAAP